MRSRSTVLAAIAAAVVIAIAGAFAAMHLGAAPPDDLDMSRAKASANGLYHVAIEPEHGEARQGELHSWIVTVTTADGAPVDDAAISIDGGMPQHGHGLPTNPQATGYLGEGRYRVEGVRFNMAGWWVLKLAVTAAPGDDAAEFNLKL